MRGFIMRPRNKVILLLLLTIIPTTITIITVPIVVNSTIELNSIFQTGGNPYIGQRGFYSVSPSFFNIEYEYMGQPLTNYNYAGLIWQKHNDSHYNLSIGLYFRTNNTPYQPPLDNFTYNISANISLVNVVSVGNAYIAPNYFTISQNDVNVSDDIFLGFFTLVMWEKYRATIEISADNTCDTGSGDIFESGQTTFQVTVLDKLHYLDFYGTINIIMFIAIIFIIILPISAVIIWRRRHRYF